MTPARIDAALVAAARSGDTAALDRLAPVSQPLMRFARRILCQCGGCRGTRPAAALAASSPHRHLAGDRGLHELLVRIVERECRRLSACSANRATRGCQPSALAIRSRANRFAPRLRHHDRRPSRPLSRGADPARRRGADGRLKRQAQLGVFGRGGEEPPPSRPCLLRESCSARDTVVMSDYQHPSISPWYRRCWHLAPTEARHSSRFNHAVRAVPTARSRANTAS